MTSLPGIIFPFSLVFLFLFFIFWAYSLPSRKIWLPLHHVYWGRFVGFWACVQAPFLGTRPIHSLLKAELILCPVNEWMVGSQLWVCGKNVASWESVDPPLLVLYQQTTLGFFQANANWKKQDWVIRQILISRDTKSHAKIWSPNANGLLKQDRSGSNNWNKVEKFGLFVLRFFRSQQ